MINLKELVNYILKFGLFYGLLNLYEIKFGSGKVKVPGLDSKIYLRPGTTDIAVFTKIFLYEEYKLTQLKGRNVSTILDAGANIGLAAVYFSSIYPAATIICVEPDAANFEQLKKNTSSYPNIRCILAGLWSTNTTLSIANPNASSWSFQVVEAKAEALESIHGITMEKLKQEFNINVLDIAKIDIEGSEKELFESGYEQWLPLTRFLIIEVHDWKRRGSSRAVFSALVNYRFSFSKKGENLIFINEDELPD